MKYTLFAALVLAAATAPAHAAGTVLFDATKAQTAGNADWTIDADTYNLGPNSSGVMTTSSGGDEANPARLPTPAASGITASTAETYWKGALSSWGVALVKSGYGVETLPNSGRITYGDSTNAQDLSHYSVYVVDEPNIMYTTAEKTAIINYVKNGGGLLIISDHTSSDRNNDGNDSIDVLNDLLANNGVQANPFGITYNADNITMTSAFIDTLATDPITHGAAGTVTGFDYNAGATMTLSTAKNSSVRAAVWSTSGHSSSSVMVAYATFGAGRVVAVGDSSPADDGTGDANDTLFDGWNTASDSRLFLNATDFLAAPEPATALLVLPAGLILIARRRCSA